MKQVFDTLLKYANPVRRPKKQEGPRFGDLNERALAAAIDIFILYFIFFPLFLWIQAKVYQHIDVEKFHKAEDAFNHAEGFSAMLKTAPLLWDSYQLQLWLFNMLVQILLIGVAILGVQFTYGTTPGKFLLGLRIVDAHTLERPARWQFAVRYFAYIISIVPLMLGFIWISFSRQHRGWHDFLARTVVLQTRPYGWYWQQLKRGFKWLRNLFRSSFPS